MLTPTRMAEGVAHLIKVDPDLARIHAEFGPPGFWSRQEGFATLVILVLEQQVSLASAGATYRRLVDRLTEPPSPQRFLELTDEELRAIGFSRQKTSYCRGLAHSIVDGELDLVELSELDDAAARARLMGQRGIGPWTADCYLLSALGRADVWPDGDRALQVAMAGVKGLAAPPDVIQARAIAEAWRPWRAVAARMLWHHYLGGVAPPGAV